MQPVTSRLRVVLLLGLVLSCLTPPMAVSQGSCPSGSGCGVIPSCAAKPSGFPIVPPWTTNTAHVILAAYGSAGSSALHCSSDIYSLDIQMALGTSIYPIAPGRVLAIGPNTSPPPSYGRFVLVDHQNGYQSLYAHLNSVLVTQNQYVGTSTLLGASGNSGLTVGSAPHLHLTLYQGAVWAGTYGAVAIKPETMVGCYKDGDTAAACNNLTHSIWLTKTGTCGNACVECILTVRPDVLEFHWSNGWSTSCSNYNKIAKNYCGTGVSVQAAQSCDAIAKNQCREVCHQTPAEPCRTRCSKCILNKRPQLIDFYNQHGWDANNCWNHNAIVNNYCTGVSAEATADCQALRRGACSLYCDY